MALEYTTEITVNLPRERVVELIDSQDNMKHWQPGFLGMTHISGEAGQEGAKYSMRYKSRGSEMEIMETILKRDFPNEFIATYDAKGVHNKQINRFVEVDANTTKWVTESYFEFGTIMMRIMAALMPGAFRKQSKKSLVLFKEWAESL